MSCRRTLFRLFLIPFVRFSREQYRLRVGKIPRQKLNKAWTVFRKGEREKEGRGNDEKMSRLLVIRGNIREK